MRISWVASRHPGFLPLAAAYAERHRYEEGKTMNRLYVVETHADGDRVQGGASAGAEAERDCGVCDGAGDWERLRRARAPMRQKFFNALLADLKKSWRQVRGDSGRAGFAGGACCGVSR